ncbi:hypothetical protein CUZ96_0727 [Enterococcus lactis]|nr:hypothetical protein [Enterococcus lactis]MBL5011064.1 hypothetical protein [Enterococcus lactis]
MRSYFPVFFSNTQVKPLISQPLIHGVPEVASYFLKLITSVTTSTD